jgi:hypothetical protein
MIKMHINKIIKIKRKIDLTQVSFQTESQGWQIIVQKNLHKIIISIIKKCIIIFTGKLEQLSLFLALFGHMHLIEQW